MQGRFRPRETAAITGVRQVYDIAIANAETAVDQYGSECSFDSYYQNCMDTLSEEGLLTTDSVDYAYKVFARTLEKLASGEQLAHEGWTAEPSPLLTREQLHAASNKGATKL